jgi:hypothetical protein
MLARRPHWVLANSSRVRHPTVRLIEAWSVGGCAHRPCLNSHWRGLIEMFHQSIRVHLFCYSFWLRTRKETIDRRRNVLSIRQYCSRYRAGLHHTHTQDSGCTAQIPSARSVSDNGHQPNATRSIIQSMTAAHPTHIVSC